MNKVSYLFSLICIAVLFCSGVYRHDVPIEEYLKLAKKSEYNCVGQVYQYLDSTFDQSASCVAIDNNYVLSAAHCFIKYTYKDTVMEYEGATMDTRVVTNMVLDDKNNYYFMINNKKYTAKRIVVHENYLANGTSDIAIVELNEPIHGILFPVVNSKKNELHDTVVAVGYGVSGPANEASIVGIYNLKIAVQNVIDSLGVFKIRDNTCYMYADFDALIHYNNCNKMGDSIPLPYEGTIGGGDSGGGLFRNKNGKNELIGINAGVSNDIPTLLSSGYYCQTMSWLRISSFTNWIEKNK